MTRRMLLVWLSALGGWLVPSSVFGQDEPSTTRKKARAVRDDDEQEPSTRRSKGRLTSTNAEDAADPDADAQPQGVPAQFPGESGFQWKSIDISRYTGLAHVENRPQAAIVDWILRATTAAPWHGDKVAVLCANRTQLRAYNSPKVLAQVAEVVERFTEAEANSLSLRVRFVTAADTRWRYAVYNRLNSVYSGPQGQQIWSLKAADSAMVMTQMQVWQGFKLIADQKFSIVNGQTLSFKSLKPQAYSGSLQREGAVGSGFQPKSESLDEGIVLRISPLLTYEGDQVDAAIELTANTVRTLIKTKILAPSELNARESTIDVPEVSETRLNQTVKGWPLGQTLLISGGVHPGILQEKGGLFGLKVPGTTPTTTELLVFLDAELATKPGRSKDRDKDRE